MKGDCKFGVKIPGLPARNIKMDLDGLTAAIAVAPFVMTFRETMKKNYPDGNAPKLKKITITVHLP